jgi:hypothetical protein
LNVIAVKMSISYAQRLEIEIVVPCREVGQLERPSAPFVRQFACFDDRPTQGPLNLGFHVTTSHALFNDEGPELTMKHD